MFVFGGSQCIRLSSTLRKSRVNSPYERYQIVSFIKPNASSEEILNSAKLFDISPNDRVLIGIGQHDSNRFKIMTELGEFLKLINCPVFVLKIFKNNYLNETKLNNLLKMICMQYKKSRFLNFNFNYYSNVNVCNEINLKLDQFDYDSKYLSFKERHPAVQNMKLIDEHRFADLNPKCNVSTQTYNELQLESDVACVSGIMVNVSTQTDNDLHLESPVDISEPSPDKATFFRD